MLSIDKYFNKKIDKLKSLLGIINKKKKSKKIRRLLIKRENIITNYFHQLSSYIINYSKKHKISTIIIGYNKNWKTKVNMNKRNNRKFYEIPFKKLIHQLFYKGENNGILVTEINESYTSKVDALSLEKICHHKKYKGKRVRRGLFKSKTTMNKIYKKYKGEKINKKILLNADINGALNIMRKYCKKNEIKIRMKKLYRKNIKKILNPIKVNWIKNKLKCKTEPEEGYF